MRWASKEMNVGSKLVNVLTPAYTDYPEGLGEGIALALGRHTEHISTFFFGLGITFLFSFFPKNNPKRLEPV